jgi:hypothetical protein
MISSFRNPRACRHSNAESSHLRGPAGAATDILGEPQPSECRNGTCFAKGKV